MLGPIACVCPRQATANERCGEAEEQLQRTESLLNKYTKDYLELKHAALEQQRGDAERIEGLRIETSSARPLPHRSTRATLPTAPALATLLRRGRRFDSRAQSCRSSWRRSGRRASSR